MADERAAVERARGDELNPAVGEIEYLQRAGKLDQSPDVIRDFLFRADQNVDRQRFLREQFVCAFWYCVSRMRAIFVGVRNRVYATWHATMLTSSLFVTAIIMSASGAPARARTSGCEP